MDEKRTPDVHMDETRTPDVRAGVARTRERRDNCRSHPPRMHRQSADAHQTRKMPPARRHAPARHGANSPHRHDKQRPRIPTVRRCAPPNNPPARTPPNAEGLHGPHPARTAPTGPPSPHGPAKHRQPSGPRSPHGPAGPHPARRRIGPRTSRCRTRKAAAPDCDRLPSPRSRRS